MTDAKAPERIWWNPEGHWSSFDDSEIRHHPSIEYIRFDLYDALAKERDELRAEVERLRNIMRSVLEVDQSVGTRSTVHDIAWSALQRKEGNE